LAALSVGIAILPGFFWFWEAHQSEYLLDFRHAGAPDPSVMSVNLEAVNLSGIQNYLSIPEIFSWHDLGNSSFLYISILVYFTILLSAVNKITRPALIMFLTILFLICMATTDTTPVHGFLYKHIYFFRLFRNNFFFIFIILPLLILFSMIQFKKFLERPPTKKSEQTLRALFLTAAAIAALKFVRK